MAEMVSSKSTIVITLGGEQYEMHPVQAGLLARLIHDELTKLGYEGGAFEPDLIPSSDGSRLS